MTKLMEWLLFTTLFFGIWMAIIAKSITFPFITDWQQAILFFPLIILLLCSIYATIIILYRVFTFNNCENAAIELQEQIEEAKKDLQCKGVILKSK